MSLNEVFILLITSAIHTLWWSSPVRSENHPNDHFLSFLSRHPQPPQAPLPLPAAFKEQPSLDWKASLCTCPIQRTPCARLSPRTPGRHTARQGYRDDKTTFICFSSSALSPSRQLLHPWASVCAFRCLFSRSLIRRDRINVLTERTLITRGNRLKAC